MRILTVVVVFFFTRLQGARPALAKREIYWYLPNRVREIPRNLMPHAIEIDYLCTHQVSWNTTTVSYQRYVSALRHFASSYTIRRLLSFRLRSSHDIKH